MRTWLPVSNIHDCIHVLDEDLLHQQVYDVIRLLKVIDTDHPLCDMWRPYINTLRVYGAYAAELAEMSAHKERLLDQFDHMKVDLPNWMGVEALHSSHRAQLLLRGERIALKTELKSLYACSTSNARAMLGQWGFPDFHLLRVDQIQFIHSALDGKWPMRLRCRNHYTQFGWSEVPCSDNYLLTEAVNVPVRDGSRNEERRQPKRFC